MRWSRWTAGLVALSLVAAACGGSEGGQGGQSADSGKEIRVAFVYDGQIDDAGWNERHYVGQKYMEENLPGTETTFVEDISPGQQAQNTFDDLAAQGYDLIVGTTFYEPDVLAIASDYPDTVFLTWAGTETAKNVGHFDAATEEGRYLDGLVAGAVTKKAFVGYPAGFPIEEVVRGINAFTIGAREVNPKVVVRPVWINSWWDPPKERQAATSLVDAGADILAHELNSPATASVAERREIHLIGYGADASKTAPNAWLGSFVFNWGPYYLEQAKAVRNGSWEPSVFYGGLAENMIDLAPFGPDVRQKTIDLVERRKQEIANGSFDFFKGPISDNEGNTIIEKGETIPRDERVTCCKWLVEGVEGEVPKG
jgi:basic membrane protein A